MFSVTRPQIAKRLLKYVRSNDVKSIQRLVGDHGVLVLVAAIGDEAVPSSTVSALIDLGVICTEPTSEDHWEAIHYAALKANKEKLSAVIDRVTSEQANSLVFCSRRINANVAKSYSNNALHILLKYGRRGKGFKDCCQMLIYKGVSVHHADSNGVTPLDLMKKEEELGDVARNLEGFTKRKKAFEMIKYDKVEDFLSLSLVDADDIDGSAEELSSCTLLQLCCTKGLTSCVKHLLECGANPNKVILKNQKFPIMTAFKKDYEDIVKLLLENHLILLPVNILITLQTKHEDKSFVKIDKHMELVLQHLQKYDKGKLWKYLTAKDDLGRTGLHYAVYNRSSDTVLRLLSLGAPLTTMDIFGSSPLHGIEPNVFEKFLDSCVIIPKDSDMDSVLYAIHNQKDTFSIEVNYEALVASENHESEFLDQMIQTKKLSSLLNHPVISIYLTMKWKNFKWPVYINFILYLISYILLFLYGFVYDKDAVAPDILLVVSIGLIMFRELCQVALFKKEYVKRVDSWINIVLFGGMIYVLYSGLNDTTNNHNLKVGYSLVFLTSTLGIFLELGNLPFFTIKVIILRQISISFFKHMLFYVFPLLAFFFCFYMLKESPDATFFQTLYDVTTMFAGDPDSNYPEQFTSNPIFSHIIYVCFIVMIGIILQNLLVGLAVNDLRDIKKEAEFIKIKERASYMTNYEREQLAEDNNWILRRMFKKWLYVFKNEYVMVIQPYNLWRLYVKENPNVQYPIKDQSLKHRFECIFKDLATANAEAKYSLKDLYEQLKGVYEKLEKIESRLDKLNV